MRIARGSNLEKSSRFCEEKLGIRESVIAGRGKGEQMKSIRGKIALLITATSIILIVGILTVSYMVNKKYYRIM